MMSLFRYCVVLLSLLLCIIPSQGIRIEIENNNNNNQLDSELPPPPVRHSQSPVSLLSVDTSSSASLEAVAAGESALAVDDSVINNVNVEDTVTAAGQLTAEEEALVNKFIPIPKTSIPSDPAVPIEYIGPPTRDRLKKKLGPRGYPWPEKLQNALTTVQDVAHKNIGQIRRHMKWQKAASKLVDELALKKGKVAAHVAALTKEIKHLLKKKKQIQNKQLQDKLVERLEVTHNNLKKVRRWNYEVRKNQADMIHHKEELAHALEGIKRSIAILKGMKRKRQFPDRGTGAKMKDELSKFDPDLSFEKEADEVRALQFPDAVLAEEDSDAYTMEAVA